MEDSELAALYLKWEIGAELLSQENGAGIASGCPWGHH